jgi:hypothetical protein
MENEGRIWEALIQQNVGTVRKKLGKKSLNELKKFFSGMEDEGLPISFNGDSYPTKEIPPQKKKIYRRTIIKG